MAAPATSLARSGRAPGDRLFRLLSLASGLAVLAILGLIAVSTTQEAWPAFRAQGLQFVLSGRWAPNEDVYGAAAFVFGTLLVSAVALALAVPVSIGIALFLTEVAPRRLRRPVTYVVDLLAAIPSVVYGLWGFLVLAPWIVGSYRRASDALGGVPVLGALFRGPVSQLSYFTAGLILALMVTPIITSITREIFDTVPKGQKEAALALGANRWEMIRGAVLPYSKGAMVGAVMLGLGRAMGETIAAALVIGSVPQITTRLFASGDALAAVIANQFAEAGGAHRAALIGLGVVLFAMTMVVNLLARLVVARGTGRAAGTL